MSAQNQLRLAVRGPGNKMIRLTMANTSTYADIVAQIRASFPDLSEFILHVGVPPRMKEIDGGNPNAVLTSLGIRSGDSIIVELGGNGAVMVQGSGGWELPPTVDMRTNRAVHYKVPGDNSCFFHSVGAALLRKNPSAQLVIEMKETVQREILSKPKEWDITQLGQSPGSYIQEMKRQSFWGGAIECSILSSYYKTEIAVVDYAALCVTTFAHYPEEGSDEGGYPRRIYLLYDGSNLNAAHYDFVVTTSESSRASALVSMEAGSAEVNTTSTFDSSLQSIFRPQDENALNLVKRLAELSHDRLVAEGKTQKKQWTAKDVIKDKNKKKAFKGASGALGGDDVLPTARPTATTSTTTTTTTTSAPKPTTTTTTTAPSTTTTTTTKPSAPVAAAPATISSTGPWSCEVCTYSNIAARSRCEMCETPKPKNIVAAPAPAAPSPTPATVAPKPVAAAPKPVATAPAPKPVQPAPKQASTASNASSSNRPWTCASCTYSNRPSATRCEMCDEARSGSGATSPTAPKSSTTATKSSPNPQDVLARGPTNSSNNKDHGDWECAGCKTNNPQDSQKCRNCNTKRSDCSIM